MKTEKLFKRLMFLKFKSMLYVLPCLVLGLLCGCGTTARDVARLELAQLVAYEEQVDNKVKAEKDFYRLTAKRIELRFSALTPYALSSSIIKGSNQAADELVGQPVKNVTDWDIMKFVDSAITDYQSNRANWNEMNTQVKENLAASLIPLTLARMQLNGVRRKLGKLQKEPTAANQIMELQAFISDTQTRLETLQKEEKERQEALEKIRDDEEKTLDEKAQ